MLLHEIFRQFCHIFLPLSPSSTILYQQRTEKKTGRAYDVETLFVVLQLQMQAESQEMISFDLWASVASERTSTSSLPLPLLDVVSSHMMTVSIVVCIQKASLCVLCFVVLMH